MNERRVLLHQGRHTGWWIEGRFGSGRLFMKTWWPSKALARMVGLWFAGPAGVVDAGTA